MNQSSHAVVMEASHVTKRYGATVALHDVTFRVRQGAVNVLIGENGAGKSTLMRLLAGAEQPTTGKILKNGHELVLASPREATKAGVAIVYQELAVMENLSVAENVFLANEPRRWGILVDRQAECKRGGEALRQLGLGLAMNSLAGDLSLGNRQVVELARALAKDTQVLILDEPTSALSATEAAGLFRVVEELKASGVAIVYISHRLNELLHLGDYFTVLRDGCVVGEGVRGDVDRRWIVERMSGVLCPAAETTKRTLPCVEERMRVRGMRVAIAGCGLSEPLDLQIGAGEIVGIYGLLGAGRTELLESLAGLRTVESGETRLNGRTLAVRTVGDAVASGIALVPEDRQRDGLVTELSIRENISLATLGRFAHLGWLRREQESARVREVAGRVCIHARDLELPVTSLSGGNQQKVLLARCLMLTPTVLLMDEPTRGVDVSAKAEIYRTLHALAAEGLSVLFATSEMEEARMLADRVLVMAKGRFVAELSTAEATDEALFAAACPALEAA